MNIPVNVLVLLFVYFHMIFFNDMNMLTVEAIVMSLVCWIWKCFCKVGWVQENEDQICWWFVRTLEYNDMSRLLKEKKKTNKQTNNPANKQTNKNKNKTKNKKQNKTKQNKTLLAWKVWTWHLEMPATAYSNVHLQLVLF